MAKILFLTQTNEFGAAARYRVYQYLDYLSDAGFEYEISPAVNNGVFHKYCRNPDFFNKIKFYSCIIRERLVNLIESKQFDAVFLQRDILIHVYPLLEKLIALKYKKIIFDFDDAIYLYPPAKKSGLIFNILWDRRKIERIIKLSSHVIAGNNFLKNYAENFTGDVTVIPTSVDLALYRNIKIPGSILNDTVNIGWIGSQGTFGYLQMLFPVFEELAKKYKIQLKVIGAKGPFLKGVKLDYKDWDLDTEIEDIGTFDIGLMPLTNDEWSKGKSGTKLLQYMAAGIPAVASGVGVNTEIIRDGVNGFLADDKEAWIKKISTLIEDRKLCLELVNNARKDVERSYSLQANAPKFIDVVKRVVSGN